MVKVSKKKDQFQERIEDLENKWKRAMADYQNLEKRIDREKQEFVRFANAQLLYRLLEVADDLERSQAHIKDEGLSLINLKLSNLLKDEGVEEIKALSEMFNPETMEAIEQVEGEVNKVIEVANKGYKIGDRVLRPAKVKVGKIS